MQSAVERIYPLVYEFRKPRTPADEEALGRRRAAAAAAAAARAPPPPPPAPRDELRLVTMSDSDDNDTWE